MAAPKEIGRKPNGMGECRPLCGCVKTTSWKYNVVYEFFFLQNNVTIVTAQDSYLIISCLRVALEAFSNVT